MQPDKYGPKTIESFEPLISLQLKELVPEREKWDDCRQEARIAVWRVLKECPDAPRAYVATATRNRIRVVAKSNLMFGDPGAKRGKPVDPLRRRTLPLDEVRVDTAESQATEADPYRVRRVRAAIASLPPAQQTHVYERFYEQRSRKDMSGSAMLWCRAGRGARDKLREALADLAA